MKGVDMSICNGPVKSALFAALALLLWPAWALAQEGTTFRPVVPPRPTDSPGKIEVIEFFSYACPHCNDFYPLLQQWQAKQGKDGVLQRGTVICRGSTARCSRRSTKNTSSSSTSRVSPHGWAATVAAPRSSPPPTYPSM